MSTEEEQGNRRTVVHRLSQPTSVRHFRTWRFGATADLLAEGDYVVGQWIGGGTHMGRR